MKRILITLLLLLVCNTAGLAQTRNGYLSHSEFNEKLDIIELGCDIKDFRQIMGKPYTRALMKYRDEGEVEQLTYKVELFRRDWYVMSYRFSFFNSKLIALEELPEPQQTTTALFPTQDNGIAYFVANVLPYILPDKTLARQANTLQKLMDSALGEAPHLSGNQ
nr:hypothetical protein [uncultured Porphyromonas sp.]